MPARSDAVSVRGLRTGMVERAMTCGVRPARIELDATLPPVVEMR